MGKKGNTSVRFANSDIQLIIQSLPSGIARNRLKLFPKIIREWSRTELPRHLSLESLKAIRDRGKKVEAFENNARALMQALNALDDAGLRRIEHRIAVTQVELTLAKQEFGVLRRFLTRLTSVEPHVIQKSRRGRQRNYIAYLIILDTAAIFEWITKTKATRRVDRDDNRDIGPFWKFAEAIWPLVFGKGKSGLSSAIKNWAAAISAFERGRSETKDQSALMANIALRHPSWRIFEK